MSEAVVEPADIDRWAADPNGPVALYLKQTLLPVEGPGAIVRPPTYADIGYNLDRLADGTVVATLDSVGSAANRMEPLFKAPAGAPRGDWLVPQFDILIREEACGACAACQVKEGKPRKCTQPVKVTRSLLEFAHRAADAAVQATALGPELQKAFDALRRTGDAGPLCSLAPTSLLFGVWDSRGGSGEKRPRLVRSVVRAWRVERLHAASQFNSVWKALDDAQKAELEQAASTAKVKLSESGFADAPSVFRKVGTAAARALPAFRDGLPNAERRVLGGVLVHGPILRELTVNLVALRGLRGRDDEETGRIRRYLLSLALVAATTDVDLFLREGCHLRYTGDDRWQTVPRRGEPSAVAIDPGMVAAFAARATQPFRSRWPTTVEYRFDPQMAKKLLTRKSDDEQESATE